MNKRVLIIEPYFGGSHKHFLKGLQKNIEAEFVFLTMPARKWKMRMQLSAFGFAKQVSQFSIDDKRFDTVLCSTFVDVAVLKTLLQVMPGWNMNASFCTYFHENQFAYPNRLAQQTNHPFSAINFSSAIVSDKIAFNSEYNMQTFLRGCEKYLKRAADMDIISYAEDLQHKSSVLYPGLDFDHIDVQPGRKKNNTVPVVLWNHRWEHDKGPEEFCDALYTVKEKGIKFKLIVLGQVFQNIPDCFMEVQDKLAEEIVHFGFAESIEDYAQLLKQGDIVVSTSLHEFYGISIIEGVRAGCTPLLPNRLSYPELFPRKFLYKDGKLAKSLIQLLKQQTTYLSENDGKALTEKYRWENLRANYSDWLFV